MDFLEPSQELLWVPGPTLKTTAAGEMTNCLAWLHIKEFIPLRIAVHPCHQWLMLALILSIFHQVSNTLSQMSNDTSQYSIESENGRIDKDVTFLPQ